MTMWAPTLDPDRPVYLALADAIGKDVAAGQLAPGSQLPTHRDLADQLGVTVGTVTRAYAEARRRGLVHGEVGRGTFVTSRAVDTRIAPKTNGLVECGLNCPAPTVCTGAIRDALAEAQRPDLLAELLRYGDGIGRPLHRERIANWLTARGVPSQPEQVMITTGAQQGLLIALSALCGGGETVLVESLTYMGMLSAARFLGLRVEAVAIDRDGAIPESFEDACLRHRPKAFYCMPTFQNPTATVMPLARREAIAAIARQHGVAILEDDIHGFLTPQPLPSIAAAVGDLGYYLNGVSKSIAGGLRIGFLRVPRMDEALTQGMWATTIMAPPLLAEVASSLLASGAAATIEACRRDEAAERQQMARSLLGEWVADGASPSCQFLWLELPPHWRPDALAAAAAAAGIRVAPAYTFAPGPGRVPPGIRISLVHEPDPERLRRGLTTLASLIREGPPRRVLGV